MPLTRLLAIAMLVFPVSALAQTQSDQPAPTAPQATIDPTSADPLQSLSPDVAKMFSLGNDQNRVAVLQDVPTLPVNPFTVSPDSRILPEVTCLRIRSFVMARDNKHSDSTHLVRYSTCQPSYRYRLKTVELQAQPPSQ